MAGIGHRGKGGAERGANIHKEGSLAHIQKELESGNMTQEQYDWAKQNIEAGRPYKDKESGIILDAEGKLPPPPVGEPIDPALGPDGNPLPGGGGEGDGRVDDPDFNNPGKIVNAEDGPVVDVDREGGQTINLKAAETRLPAERIGPRSALFPRMNLDINDGKPLRDPADGKMRPGLPNTNQLDPAGVRGIRRDDQTGRGNMNAAFKERGVSFDNPMQINDGILSRVDIPDQQAVPPVPKAPDPLKEGEEDAAVIAKHEALTKAHAKALANRDEIIRQNTEALKMRNEARADFSDAGIVRGQLASSGSGMTKNEQGAHNKVLRDQARQANNNRIMKNKLKDFRGNSNMQRGVSNWVDQSIANGELDPETLGGESFNEIMRNNPDQAMRLVQDFKDRSAQDAIKRNDIMRPKPYTEAQVQKAMADAGFQNVNGRMVSGDQARAIQKRMGLPGEHLGIGLAGPDNWQKRNPHGVLTAHDGTRHPDNPFGGIETPALTQGIDEGKVVRGNPAAVAKIGPDGRPYLEPSTDQPFMPGPNYVHNPSWPSADNRRFTPGQLSDQGRQPLGPSNWDRPTIPNQHNPAVRMPVPPAVKAAHDRVRGVEGKIDDLSAPAPQTQIPGAGTGADPSTHPFSGPPQFNNPVPQGGIPGLGPQNSPQNSPQDAPSPKPTLQYGQTLPGKRLSPEEEEELKRKQGLFG